MFMRHPERSLLPIDTSCKLRAQLNIMDFEFILADLTYRCFNIPDFPS